MTLIEVAGGLVGIVSVYLLHKQNKIFERQNELLEQQNDLQRIAEGIPVTPSVPRVSRARRYWPLIAMGVLMCLTYAAIGYDIYDRRSTRQALILSELPITLGLEVHNDILPIRVHVGQIGYIAPLNPALDRIPEQQVLEINNTNGATLMQWPDARLLEDARKKLGRDPYASTARLDIINHGSNDILSIKIPLKRHYGNNFDLPWHVSTLALDSLAANERRTVYIVNPCQIDATVTVPVSGTAKVAGDQNVRDFNFEGARTSNIGLSPSIVNWTGTSCE